MSTRIRAIITAILMAFFYLISLLGLLDQYLFKDLIGLEAEEHIQIATAGLISFIMFLMTAWTLFFKRKGSSVIAVMMFPAVTIFPYTLFSDTVLNSYLGGFGQFIAIPMIVAGFWVLSYFLVLTANVLNGAMLYNIPLGQAGKASQFVFSLISSYLLVAFLNSVDIPIVLKTISISGFTLYWAISAIWAMGVSRKHVIFVSAIIALTMALLTLSLSIWPIPAVYSTVITVIFFYVLLNVSLEIRHRIGGAFWVEYILLVGLSLMLMIFLGDWGIAGTLV
jgi:hypothetical protein